MKHQDEAFEVMAEKNLQQRKTAQYYGLRGRLMETLRMMEEYGEYQGVSKVVKFVKLNLPYTPTPKMWVGKRVWRAIRNRPIDGELE